MSYHNSGYDGAYYGYPSAPNHENPSSMQYSSRHSDPTRSMYNNTGSVEGGHGRPKHQSKKDKKNKEEGVEKFVGDNCKTQQKQDAYLNDPAGSKKAHKREVAREMDRELKRLAKFGTDSSSHGSKSSKHHQGSGRHGK